MNISELDVRKTWALQGTLNFTRFCFKSKTGSRFIVGHHHEKICSALDAVVRGEIKRLIINIAPRYSKTEVVVKNFISYGFAINPRSKFIHLSYSDDLVLNSSKEIRELMQSDEYASLFDARVSGGSNKMWFTTQGGVMYAVSSGGQVTGFGAGLVEENESQKEIDDFIPYYDSSFAGAIIIDDPIKPEDALSDLMRERINNRFETTIRNRVNSRNTPIIIIMQRLHEKDLCGYLQSIEPDEWTVLSLPCITTDDQGKECALWPHKHTLEELHKLRSLNNFVFETQYMQNPIPAFGLLYGDNFKTYTSISGTVIKIGNYTDTADTGTDFLCSICYIVAKDKDTSEKRVYITDVIYTDEPMEKTEPAVADMLKQNGVLISHIESNNGGRGFARAIKRFTPNVHIDTFSQTGNKESRILTNSTLVVDSIYFPDGWKIKWPAFFNDLVLYRRLFKANKHDDAPDALTGIVEKEIAEPKIMRIGFTKN